MKIPTSHLHPTRSYTLCQLTPGDSLGTVSTVSIGRISADLLSHPKVREMFRKSREINQIHFFMRFKDEKLTDENPSPLFQINKTQSRIRCSHLQDKSNASGRKRIRCTLSTCIYTNKFKLFKKACHL